MDREEFDRQLKDLIVAGIIEEPEPDMYQMSKFGRLIHHKVKNNIPLTQEERNQILLTGSTVEEVLEAFRT